MFKSIPLLALLPFFFHCPSHAVEKCLLNGKITYTDLPCPAGSETLPFTGHVAPPDDPAGAQKRLLADQKKLKQVLKENEQQEKMHEHNARIAAQQSRLAQEKENRCKKLDAKRRAAQQAKLKNKHGNQKQIAHANKLAEQAEDNYAERCLDTAR